MRVEAISNQSVERVQALQGLSYPDDAKLSAELLPGDRTSVANDNRQIASNTLNGAIGQFGATDPAQFLRTGSAQAAAQANPASSAGLPYVQRPELTNPTASTGLEKLAIQNLLK